MTFKNMVPYLIRFELSDRDAFYFALFALIGPIYVTMDWVDVLPRLLAMYLNSD